MRHRFRRLPEKQLSCANYIMATQTVIRSHLFKLRKDRLRNLQRFLRVTKLHLAPSNLILNNRGGVLCKFAEVQCLQFIERILVLLF